MKHYYQIILFFSAGICAFVSCDLSLLGGNNASRQYSIVSPEDEISNIPTDDFFYVNIKSAYYTGGQGGFDPLDFELYAMDEGPGTDCKISVNEEAGTEDLYCMLDVAEGDLWYHEINLEYNVPPNMCKYLGFTTHWHYNQEVGDGPQRVVEIETTRGDETVTTYSPCRQNPPYICERRERSTGGDPASDWEEDWSRYRGFHCNNLPEDQKATEHCFSVQVTDANQDNASIQEKYRDDTRKVENEADAHYEYRCQTLNTQDYCRGTYREEEKVCEYNKSDQEGKANCCLGKYFLVRTGQTAEEKEWGGDISQCVGGLGRLNWQTFDDDGWPITLVEETGSRGLNKDYALRPLIREIKTRVSFPTANYFEGQEDKEGSSGANFPAFYTNPNQCDGDNCRTGHPYITWTCLDQNQEVLHQINFVIREWNSQEEFARFKESQGSRGDPDVTGAEGSECEHYESDEGFLTVFNNCNDIQDADDWNANSRPGSYPEINYGGGSGS